MIAFWRADYFHERPQSPYYGASDTTPLFLVLLDEYERWTGDTDLVRALEPNARAALDWIDHFGDRDGDGYIEYQRKTTWAWKTSAGRIPGTPSSSTTAHCRSESSGHV